MAQLSLRSSFLVLCLAVLAALPAEAKQKVRKPLTHGTSNIANQLLLKRQYGAAIKQLELRANAGDTNAQLKLGSMYRVGLGVDANRDKASVWLGKAAAAGNRQAALALDRMQVDVPPTPKKQLNTSSASSGAVGQMASLAWLPAKPQNQPGWLTLAAARNLTPVIEALQQAGEKQFHADRDAALLAASRAGSVNAAAAILEAGANPNAKDAMAKTPIVIAAQFGNVKLAQQLLSATPDLAARDASGRSALFYAAASCDVESFKALMNDGAKDDGASLPATVMAVTSCQNARDFAQLVRSEMINKADAAGRTAVWHAATLPENSVLQALLAAGGDPTLADAGGYLPLHAAAAARAPEALRLLLTLAKGGDVPSRSGVTPLMLAAYRGCIECVRLLAEQSSDIDLKDNAGETALLLAVQSQQAEVARFLLQRGANAKARSESGDTPEKLASRLGGEVATLFPK